MNGRLWGLAPLLILTMIVSFACAEKAAPPPVPPEVTITPVVQQDVPVYIENIGQTRGAEEVDVRARAQGFLQTIDFVEGTLVKQGQLLYTIDPRELSAQLENAKGNLARAEAAYARATQDVERFRPLAEKNAIPKQDLETSIANQSAAKAMVESSKAMVDQAAISLGYCRIYAPVTGLIGKSEVNVGNLVGSGQNTLLTTISKINPIRVRFSISERDYLAFAKKYGTTGKTMAEQLPIELILADGAVHPFKGHLTFADRVVDPETGTLLLEASFPNPDGIVRTGQYARVRFAVDVRKGALLVPQRAVQELQATYSVAVVSGDKVELRTVTPGPRVGSSWVIDNGLKPGDKVVVEGLQKVKNGIQVKASMLDLTASPLAGAAQAKEN